METIRRKQRLPTYRNKMIVGKDRTRDETADELIARLNLLCDEAAAIIAECKKDNAKQNG